MCRCWAEYPGDRPTIGQLQNSVKKLNRYQNNKLNRKFALKIDQYLWLPTFYHTCLWFNHITFIILDSGCYLRKQILREKWETALTGGNWHGKNEKEYS